MWDRETKIFVIPGDKLQLASPARGLGFGSDPAGRKCQNGSVNMCVFVNACVALNQPLGLGEFVVLGVEQARPILCVLLGHLSGNRCCPRA